MSTIGNLLVKIGADTKGLESGLSKAQGSVSSFAGGVGSIAKTAVKSTAIAGAAFAGVSAVIAGKGLKDFATFEQGMNEVFTLLPDMSEKAMSAMEEDVKSFANKFGVLPQDTIPSLYQAISAGVPANNVFEYLETAQMAAKGGVTSLEIAVDGISSVVNSYGDEVVSAAQASDLMFIAVKKGKTTFEELAGHLYHVIPTASSLGVAFEDVTAAMATMTAGGTPTSVASSELRQMLVELSKAGGNAANTFENMAGKSFAEFVSEGGNVASALKIMEQAADKNGVALKDLFGSVEAGNAAIGIAGKNSKRYAENLAEMGNATGATQKAFERMNQGILSTLNRAKASITTTFISIGDALAPAAEEAIGGFTDILAGRAGGAERMANGAKELIETFVGGLLSNLPNIINVALSIVNGLVTAIVTNIPAIVDAIVMMVQGIADTILNNAPAVLEGFMSLLWSLVNLVLTMLPDFITLGAELLVSLMEGIAENIPILIPLAQKAIMTLVETLVTLLPVLLETGIEVIASLIKGIAGMAPELIPLAINLIMELVMTILDNLDVLIDAGIELLLALALGIAEAIPDLIEYLPKIIGAIVRVLLENHPLLVEAGFQILFALIAGLIKAIPEIVEAMPNIITEIKDAFLNTDWASIGENIIEGIVKGLKNTVGLIKTAAQEAGESAFNAIKNFLKIGSPSKLFERDIGVNMGLGMIKGMDKMHNQVDRSAANMVKVPKVATPKMQGSNNGVMDALIEALSDLKMEASFAINGKEMAREQATWNDESLQRLSRLRARAGG